VTVTATNGAVTNMPTLQVNRVSNSATIVTNTVGGSPVVVTNETLRLTFMARPNRPINVLYKDPGTTNFYHVTATNVPFISPTNQPRTNETIRPAVFTPRTGVINLTVQPGVDFFLGRTTNR
jgi:hypothetical protein